MPKYFPIDAGVKFDCSESDLLAVEWKTRSLSADFLLPGVEGRAVRIRFDEATIVRLGAMKCHSAPKISPRKTKDEFRDTSHIA